MRVSTAVKELRTPYLYHRLEWEDVQRGALDKDGRHGREDVGNIPKKDDLLHVWVVELHPYVATACTACPLYTHPSQRQHDKIVIPVIRIDTSRPCPNARLTSEVCLDGRHCGTLSNLHPKKLVLKSEDREYMQTRVSNLGRLPADNLEDVVVHVNIHMNRWRRNTLRTAPHSHRLVMIVPSCGYNNNDGDDEPDDLEIAVNRVLVERGGLCCLHFIQPFTAVSIDQLSARS